MPTVYPTSFAIEAELAGVGGGWTALTADVHSAEPILWSYGIEGHALEDRVARPGELTFALNNSQYNSGAKLGYYSPDHANLRSGFQIGINIRFSVTYAGVTYYKFHGRLCAIKPLPGQYLSRLALCLVRDWMDEASRAKLKRIAIQQLKRADEVLTTIVTAVPRQPVSTTFGVGRDTYIFALDHSPEEGLGVMEECQRLAQSEVGFIYVKGNTTAGGELVFESRTDRAAKNTNLATFTDSMIELDLGRDRDDIVTRLQVITHPKRKDTTNQILFTLRDPNVADATALSLLPGESKTLVCPYTDPSDRNHRIGAISTSMVAPVATTDYLFFANADGTGTNLTASLSASTIFGATAAFTTLTNNHATSSGFVTFFQLRGPGVYDEQDQLWERTDATAEADFGEQTLTYDMPYQSDPDVGDGAARYFLYLFKSSVTNVQGKRFLANWSASQLTQALVREPGDRIGIAETATGISTATPFFIHGCQGEYHHGGIVFMRWNLAPASQLAFWLLGVSGVSELGTTTVLGF